MKGHKEHHHRKGRASGGMMESAKEGSKEWEEDLAKKNIRYTGGNPENEAEERKRGGKAKKHLGKMGGEKAKCHAGRKPRKNGGRTGADSNPFSSARAGVEPKGHKSNDID